MGIFVKLFGQSHAPKDKMIPWLDKADDAYCRAFQTRLGNELVIYFTAKCVSKILERIRLGETIESGLDRYKNTTYEKVDENETSMTYKKTVTYDNIKMSHGIVVPVGDSYSELWMVVWADKEKNLISEVRRIDGD